MCGHHCCRDQKRKAAKQGLKSSSYSPPKIQQTKVTVTYAAGFFNAEIAAWSAA